MAGRTGIAIALLTLFAGGAAPIAPMQAPMHFATLDNAGVAFDGSYTLNQFLLDGPRPFDVKVSNGAEPSMLASRDGSTIWIGDTSGLYRSTNDGATWTRSSTPFLPGVFSDGWALAEDAQGRLYASTTQGQASGVAMSTTKGATWNTQSFAVSVGSISDRPWLAARGDGEVALVVNSDRGEECYRSTDAGQTWLSMSHVNNGQPNAGNLVFTSDGKLYYSNGARIQIWRHPCAEAPSFVTIPASGPAIFTQVDVDEQDRVYFANPSADSTKMILYARPSISSTTFRELVVSAPALRSNTFPTLSVLDSGEIAVGWYGSETPGNPSVDSFAGSWNVYVARIQGFWTSNPTITTTRVTTQANHVGDFCMGGIGCTTGAGDRDLLDYFMVDMSADRTIHVAYGHDGTGSASEVRYARIDP